MSLSSRHQSRNRGTQDASHLQPHPWAESVGDTEDYSYNGPMLKGDRKIKVWVPEPVFEALTLAASDRDCKRPDMVRRIWFQHLFGRAKLVELDVAHPPHDFLSGKVFFCRPDPGADIPPPEPRLPLGKRTVDAVILVSDDVYEALDEMAQRADKSLGTYASRVLCWAMFGRGVHAGLAMQVTQGQWLGDEGDEPETREPPP